MGMLVRAAKMGLYHLITLMGFKKAKIIIDSVVIHKDQY